MLVHTKVIVVEETDTDNQQESSSNYKYVEYERKSQMRSSPPEENNSSSASKNQSTAKENNNLKEDFADLVGKPYVSRNKASIGHGSNVPGYNRRLSMKPAVSSHTQNDNDVMEKNIEDTLLYLKLKPLFILMKITGIFFAHRRRSLNVHHRLRSFRKCSIQQAWCTAILIILTLNFLRSLTTFIEADFSSFSNQLFFKIIVVIFFYESMCRAALAYTVCFKNKNGLEDFFKNIENTCYPDRIIPYEGALVKTNWFFIGLTFILSLCNLASVIYGIYFAPPEVMSLFDAYLAPVTKDSSGKLVFELFVLLLTFVNAQTAARS